MIRHDEPGISVRISDLGLRRYAIDQEWLARMKRTERLHETLAKVGAWGMAGVLAFMWAWACANGN